MKKRLTIRETSPEECGSRFEIDLTAMLHLLFRRRRWIVGVVGLVSLMTVIIMLATPNRYTSHALILPSGKTNNLSAIRAMAGLAGGLGLKDENSSALYPVVLSSHLVQDALLAKTYRFTFEGEPMELTLQEYIGTEDPDRLRRALAGMTTIGTSSRAGEITISVETEYPEFSRLMVNEYVDRLEDFNLHSRRSEAGERVRYLARELDGRRRRLEAAEDSLEAFQGRHRNWANTSNPIVLKELVRLKREAEVKAQTYGYLLQEYEVAKLDAQKDVPIVRVLDRATLPTQKSGPFRSVIVITATAISFFAVVLALFVVDLVKRTSAQVSDDSQELRQEIEEAFPRTAALASRLASKAEREIISVDS